MIRFPSKYAARISQAFTATDPSNIRITRDQWEEIPDIIEKIYNITVEETSDISGQVKEKRKPNLFTDGVGTISTELGDRLWAELCKSRRDQGKNAIKPSAVSLANGSLFRRRLTPFPSVPDSLFRLQGCGSH